MDNYRLEITERDKGPDSKLRVLREEGLIPGILYGREDSNQLIQLKEREILKHLKLHSTSGIFNVEFGSELIPVKVNEIQKDVINNKLFHIDLQRIESNKEIEILIPIVLDGKALGVDNGGTIQQHLRYLKVRSLPSLTPESIIIDISGFDIGYNLYVRDINTTDDVKILNNLNTILLSVLPPQGLAESVDCLAPIE
ncbi:MAG: 50S ribosomal protein L25 [Vulcanibacillus sp.]